MKDEDSIEPWIEKAEEVEKKNPWLIKREEEKELPQRETVHSFFKGGEKIEIRKILDKISKHRGWSGFNGHPQKEEMLKLNEELFRGRTHLNKDDIKRAISSLKRRITWAKGNEKQAIRDYIKRLEDLIK